MKPNKENTIEKNRNDIEENLFISAFWSFVKALKWCAEKIKKFWYWLTNKKEGGYHMLLPLKRDETDERNHLVEMDASEVPQQPNGSVYVDPKQYEYVKIKDKSGGSKTVKTEVFNHEIHQVKQRFKDDLNDAFDKMPAIAA